MHRFSGQGSHEDKIPPPPLSRLRAGGSVQTAVQSGGSNAAETRGLAGRGSRLPVSPWRQPRAGPSYGGAGRGLPWPGQKDLRAVPSPEVQTAPHRDDPSFLFFFGSSHHALLPWRSPRCGRRPNSHLSEKQAQRGTESCSNGQTTSFRAVPRQNLLYPFVPQIFIETLLLGLSDLAGKLQEAQLNLNFK